MRTVKIDGVYNMRDLGGLGAEGGKQIKKGVLYRSADLGDVSDGGLDDLDRLSLRTVVDFRFSGGDEGMKPDILPYGIFLYRQIPVGVAEFFGGKLKPEDIDVEHMMYDVYELLVREFQPQFKDFLSVVANSGGQPLLFHCTAGKDRTGVAAAFILSALGVSRDDIIHDYMLSNAGLSGRYDDLLSKNPALEPLVWVKEDYLKHAFDIIDKEYGGIENYLTTGLRADIARLRSMYLI